MHERCQGAYGLRLHLTAGFSLQAQSANRAMTRRMMIYTSEDRATLYGKPAKKNRCSVYILCKDYVNFP
jgi:hypothetical protein